MLRGMGYKASVVINHAEIPAELLDAGGRFGLSDCGHSFWEGPDAVPVYMVAQEFQTRLAEGAFGSIHHQAVLIENFEQTLQVL